MRHLKTSRVMMILYKQVTARRLKVAVIQIAHFIFYESAER